MDRLGAGVAACAWLCVGAPVRAGPPAALVSQEPDGSVSILLRPDRDWESAELVIVGGDTIELGPARGGESLEIDGWAERKLSHMVVLRVAEPNGCGVTWRFVVDTQVVPDPPPRFKQGAAREWKKWLFGPKPPGGDPQP